MTSIQKFRSVGLLILAGLLTTPAFAGLVTYSTTGSFSGSAGGALTYALQPSTTVTAPTIADFGVIASNGIPYTPVAGDGFSLTVTQTVPSPGGSETLSDSFSGMVTSVSESNLVVRFTTGGGASPVTLVTAADSPTFQAAYEFVLGGVTYYVDQNTPIPASDSGIGSTIGGYVSDTPEPAFYSLIATGFAGLLFMSIRRRRQSQV